MSVNAPLNMVRHGKNSLVWGAVGMLILLCSGIGTLAYPIIGTLIGAVIGLFIGGLLGSTIKWMIKN